MQKSPLQLVKEQHGDKSKLVDKLVSSLDRGGDSKDEFRTRLNAMPNTKLLRLHRVQAELKDRFGGSKDKLLQSLLDLMGRSKDKDYKESISDWNSCSPAGAAPRLGKEGRY